MAHHADERSPGLAKRPSARISDTRHFQQRAEFIPRTVRIVGAPVRTDEHRGISSSHPYRRRALKLSPELQIPLLPSRLWAIPPVNPAATLLTCTYRLVPPLEPSNYAERGFQLRDSAFGQVS